METEMKSKPTEPSDGRLAERAAEANRRADQIRGILVNALLLLDRQMERELAALEQGDLEAANHAADEALFLARKVENEANVLRLNLEFLAAEKVETEKAFPTNGANTK